MGSASKPPTETAAAAFEERTGARLELHFGGSGAMMASLELSGRGDIYFPGSSDYMELAKRRQLVDPSTERIVVYLLPAVNVQRGNPKGIRSVEDLGKPGIRIGMARPDTVCVGLYAVEVLKTLGLVETVRPNIVTQAPSCAKTAQLLSLGTVDAILGWRVFEYWDPERIETVFLPRDKVPRIGYIPAAVVRSSPDPRLAQEFLEFLTSEEGQAHYRRWNYLTTLEEAREYATPSTPVGGEWELPATWR